MYKIVVTGGRDYANKELVQRVISAIGPKEIYVGDANGADRHARVYAALTNIESHEFVADWGRLGNSAGPLRNQEMLEHAGKSAVVIAFKGGAGTENCVKQALRKGMLVLRVEEP